MIYFYEGTPGSGKSYHIADRIWHLMRSTNVNIIANFPVDVPRIFLTGLGYRKYAIVKRLRKLGWFKGFDFKKYNSKPIKGNFQYVGNHDLTPQYLIDYCNAHHKTEEISIGGQTELFVPEDQTLVIIDEARIKFNCRAWNAKDRESWLEFLPQHRKYGFNIILIAQSEMMIDKQIRPLVEMYVAHRNLKYYNLFAKILSFISGGSLFVVLYRWQGVKDIMSREFYRYKPRIASIYNSYRRFSENDTKPQGEVQEDVESIAS